MLKKSKNVLSNFIGIVLFSLPILSFAASEESRAEMTKDEWLSKIKEAVPGPICKGFMEDASIAKRLQEHKINYQGCVDLIPTIADKCQKKYYGQLPAIINQEHAMKWGRTLGECIGMEFAMEYLYSEPATTKSSENPGNAEGNV